MTGHIPFILSTINEPSLMLPYTVLAVVLIGSAIMWIFSPSDD